MNKRLVVVGVLLVLLILFRMALPNAEGFADADTKLVIAKANWCGHCRTAAPVFERLKSESPLTLSNGKRVLVQILDSDEDKEEIKKYNVKGFPSIMLIKDGNTMEYSGERSYDAIKAFLE